MCALFKKKKEGKMLLPSYNVTVSFTNSGLMCIYVPMNIFWKNYWWWIKRMQLGLKKFAHKANFSYFSYFLTFFDKSATFETK